MTSVLNRARTSVLEIAYEQHEAEDGVPVLLMHGFPYDPRTYDLVVPLLVTAGCRVIVPYLRGYGPTRFLAAETPRSGQQAALGNDLKELIDALGVRRPVLAGYDWGGRAACVVAALWPDKVRGLCQPMATTFRISLDRPHRRRPSKSTACGISITSTPSVAAPA